MRSSLLLTKLTPPALTSEIVPRPRLHQLLNQTWQRPLTTLIAPAGFGKTTAVLHWLSSHNPHASPGWLALDERDNDPQRYLTYLLTALYSLSDDEQQYGLALLHSGATAEAALTAALNTLHTLTTEALLILDDFHLLETPATHTATQFLIDHLPPKLHLLLTSRQGLPLSLARLRARRQLVEITAAELRFTAAETTRFLTDLHQLDLPAGTSDLLTARTEGWAAGLQLATITLETLPADDIPTFLHTFGGDNAHIATYLLEEAWRHQPAEVQTFLRYTALFERFSLQLCQAVLPEELPAAELFTYVQSANLFLIPLDPRREWFRYHHLFRDFLRQQLEHSDIDPNKLHKQAAVWLSEQQLYDEAMQHLTTAAAWEEAIQLIHTVGFELFISGQTNLVQSWLAGLPEERILSDPRLAMYRAVIRMNQFRLEEAERYLQYAERFLEELPLQEARFLMGQIAAGRAGIATMQGDAERIVRQAKIALDYLPPEELRMRASVAYSLGFAHLHQGDYPAAIREFQQTVAQGRESGSWHLFVLAQIQLGYLHNVRGDTHQAAEACQQAIKLHQAPRPVAAPLIGLAYTGAAVIAWEANRLDEALALTLTGLELCQLALNPQSTLSAYVSLIYLHIMRDEHEQAQTRLREAQQVVAQQPQDGWMQAMLATVTALVDAAEGNLAAAVGWLHTLNPEQELSFDGQNAILHAYLNSVQLDVATFVSMRRARETESAEVWQTAAQLFTVQRQKMAALRFLYPQAKLMAVEALAYQALGQPERAQTLLAELLTIAAARDYVLLFVQWGRPMRELLETAADTAPYARTLLTHFPDPPVLLLDALTPREEEVLALIAAGLTNQQIADQLHITYGTTKRHVNSIYSKLDVNARPQAILKAQALGLG